MSWSRVGGFSVRDRSFAWPRKEREVEEGQYGHLPGPNRSPRLPSTLASPSATTRRRKWQIRRRRIACSGKYVGALLTLATGGVATVRVAIN